MSNVFMTYQSVKVSGKKCVFRNARNVNEILRINNNNYGVPYRRLTMHQNNNRS